MIKVGWDYDEPICKWFDLAHQASLEAGIALPEHEPTSWKPYESYVRPDGSHVTLEEWVRVLDDEVLKGQGGMYAAPLDDVTKWQLHRLADVGFENHIVTARGSFGELGPMVEELTRQQIDREGLPITSVTFNKHKSAVVNALGLDYFIDDAPHNYEDLIENCPNTEIYLLDERWNQDLDVPADRRLTSVEEYVDLILAKHAVHV